MSCIDGFVIAVPAAHRSAFIDHVTTADAAFIEYGAIRVVEAWGDDVPAGQVTDFRRAVQATADEVVVFSWIEWPDKATRDAGMARIMEDPRMDADVMRRLFDGKRMIFGSFAPVVDLAANPR